MLRIILVLAASVLAGPDLVAPFTVDLKSQTGALDTVIVTTYLANIGNADTKAMSFDAHIVSIGVDSNNFLGHKVPANKVLPPGGLVVYKDTIAVFPGPFSIFTWVDPLVHLGEGGGDLVNNVRSQGYNYYPKIIKDTVRVVIRDTVKYCPPTLAKASQSIEDYRTGLGMDALGRSTKVWARCKD